MNPAPKPSSGNDLPTGDNLDTAFAVLHSALNGMLGLPLRQCTADSRRPIDASKNAPAQDHVQAEPKPTSSEAIAEQPTDAKGRYDHPFGLSAYGVDVDDFNLANDIEADADEEFSRIQLPIEYGQPLMDNTSALDVLSYPIRPGDYIPNYTIFSSLVHVPTTLIEYWFSNVCSMWSAFDSELNYSR